MLLKRRQNYLLRRTGESMRLTKKKLIEMVNQLFDKYEIKSFEVYAISATRYRGQDYEAGACKLHIYFRRKDGNIDTGFGTAFNYFISFFSIKELEYYINNGYYLKLEFIRQGSISIKDLELNVQKIFL